MDNSELDQRQLYLLIKYKKLNTKHGRVKVGEYLRAVSVYPYIKPSEFLFHAKQCENRKEFLIWSSFHSFNYQKQFLHVFIEQ